MRFNIVFPEAEAKDSPYGMVFDFVLTRFTRHANNQQYEVGISGSFGGDEGPEYSIWYVRLSKHPFQVIVHVPRRDNQNDYQTLKDFSMSYRFEYLLENMLVWMDYLESQKING
jgi:hypothetical protein